MYSFSTVKVMGEEGILLMLNDNYFTDHDAGLLPAATLLLPLLLTVIPTRELVTKTAMHFIAL